MTRVPALRPGLITDITNGEFVVVDPETGAAHLLSGAAADAYRACAAGTGSPSEEGLAALASAGLLEAGPTRRLLLTGVVVGAGLVTTLALPALPAAASGTTGGDPGPGTSAYYGGDRISRPSNDGRSEFYLDLAFPLVAGTLTSFSGYASQNGSVYGIVFGPDNKVAFVSNSLTATTGSTFTIPAAFPVVANSTLGIGFDAPGAGGAVPFDNNGLTVFYSPAGQPKPAVGTSRPTDGSGPRTYSFGANITS